MTLMTVVTQDDVRTLLHVYKPGTAEPSTVLYARYTRIMEQAGRPVASRNALGRALTLYGCVRHRNRHRSGGKQTEVNGWVIPGASYEDNQENQVRALLQVSGPGFHRVDEVYERYCAMGRDAGWRNTLSKNGLSRRLRALGRPQLTEKGSRCWFFS
jgi:hypothetical protein